jgi:AcrR family transcriptional regulator
VVETTVHDDLVGAPVPLREARKERTRRALLDAALALTDEVGFASVSLRQVTKAAGIVPTAFYRHYDSMDALGETLVVESFHSLRQMIRAVRSGGSDPAAVITRSAEVLVSHVHAHREHFRFIARERSGGVAALRRSIHHELGVIVSELADDFATFPVTEAWSGADRTLLAELIVNQMVVVAERILDSPDEEVDVVARAERQLTMVLVGAAQWRSR